MYIIKNALVSIKRNIGRNILVALIIIVIAASSTVTLAIKESAEKIIKSYEEQNKIEATISLNRENMLTGFREDNKSSEDMINTFNNIESITLEDIENYGNSSYLEKYYYTYEISLNAKDIKEATDSLVKETTTVDTETTTRTEEFERGFPEMPPGNNGGSKVTTNRKTTTTKTEKIFNEKANAGVFTLLGYSSLDDMKEFIDGDYTIISGEVSTDFASLTCVISEELATLNELEVGNIITLVNPKDENKTYEVTITGIYKENTDSANKMNSMFTSSANKIITNVNVIKTILESSDIKATITPTFVLKDSDSLTKFEEEVKEKGLSSYYQIDSNVDEINEATESVKNVRVFATTFLIITLIIGGVVLIVINMINIRERKYEIGVLRTIGMKKTMVSIEFMFELLVVCLVALMIGAGIGSYASVPVANKLLQNEISNANSKYENISTNFGKPNMSFDNGMPDFKVAKVDKIDSIEAVVDMKVLVELLGIGLMLTVVGSLASMISISRFSPLTILKERS